MLVTAALAGLGVRVAVVAFGVEGLPARQGDVDVIARARYRDHPAAEAREIVRALRRTTARAVVTRTAGSHTGVVGLASRGLGRRFVYSSANVADFRFEEWEESRAKRALYGLGVRAANEIVVQTDEQVTLCRERFGHDPVLIRSIAERAPQRTAEPVAFLWIGRVIDYKQPLAYVDLARAVPEARFAMVAVPEARGAALHAQVVAAAAGVDNLELLEPRPRAQLMELVDRAIALVSTSSSEGMPNIWLEGWARGVPALTLAHDPDGIIARHRLGEVAGADPARLARLAREQWAARHAQREVAARCRTYLADHHGAQVVARQWAQALRLPAAS